jgi:hypothetical protein
MDPYCGATLLYYESCKSSRKIVPCVMMKNYNIKYICNIRIYKNMYLKY